MNPQNQAVQAVMGMALPQTVIPVTKTETQVQRTQYNPNKLQAVLDALRTPRTVADNRKSAWEIFGNALANIEPVRNSTGAYGMEVANPYIQGLNSFARSFGGAYSARKENERDVRNAELEAQNMAREDAIKAAQIAMDADKQVITDQIASDYMKVNDPNAKGAAEQAKLLENIRALEALRDENRKLAGDFDNSFTVYDKNGNVDVDKTLEAYRGASGTLHTWQNPNSWWGWGTSKKEADARNKSATLRETQLNNIYQSLKGAGAITDTELETMGKTAKEAYNPYLLDLTINNTLRNLKARYGLDQQHTTTNNGVNIDDIYNRM